MDGLGCVIATGQQLKNIISDSETIYIYGAHLIAENLLYWMRDKECEAKLKGFIVTSHEHNPDAIQGYPVKDINEIDKELDMMHREKILVIVSTPEKFWEQINKTLNSLNIYNVKFLGLNNMTDILGDEEILYINHIWNRLCADKDANDTFCINIYQKSVDQVKSGQHYKMPVLMKKPLAMAEPKESIEEWVYKTCYSYAEKIVNGLQYASDSTEASQKVEGFTVYRVCSPFDQILKGKNNTSDYWIRDIQAGAELSETRVSNIADNVGCNISAKNKQYAEMTAMYWAWKNDKTSKYKGLCHYRRAFCLNRDMIYRMVNDDVDVIVTTPRVLILDVKSYFYETPVTEEVFEILMDVLKEMQPEYYEHAKKFYESNIYVPNNMVIAKTEIFNEYCSWIFPILFQLEELCMSKFFKKKDRYIAYSAEILTAMFFDYHLGDWKTVSVDYEFVK